MQSDSEKIPLDLVQQTLQIRTLSIATLVGLAHIISGFAILVAPSALFVTPLYLFHETIQYLHLNVFMASSILIMAGALAILGSTRGMLLSKKTHVLLFCPQQLLLVLQLLSITKFVLLGQYHDGYTPQGGSWFILADQIWSWILPMSHTLWLTLLMLKK